MKMQDNIKKQAQYQESRTILTIKHNINNELAINKQNRNTTSNPTKIPRLNQYSFYSSYEDQPTHSQELEPQNSFLA